MAKNLYGIVDTGYAKTTTTSGTKFTRVSSGAEVILPAKSLVLLGSMNFDDTATPTKTASGVYAQSEVNTNSINNNSYTLVAKFKRNVAAEMTALKNVFDMRASKGVKILYYMGTSASYTTLVNLFGGTDSNHSSTGSYTSDTTEHIHCFVTNVSINENNGSAGGIITATITLKETA